jgi:hypothetical protein
MVLATFHPNKMLMKNAKFVWQNRRVQSEEIISTNPMKCLKFMSNMSRVCTNIFRLCKQVHGNNCQQCSEYAKCEYFMFVHQISLSAWSYIHTYIYTYRTNSLVNFTYHDNNLSVTQYLSTTDVSSLHQQHDCFPCQYRHAAPKTLKLE